MFQKKFKNHVLLKTNANTAQQPSQASLPPPHARGTPLSSPCPIFDPTLDTILMAPIPTCRHVPNACRQDFASVLGHLLAEVVTAHTWEAVYNLLVFPKLVLRHAKRGGQMHQKQLASDVSRRLQLFRQLELHSLWAEAAASHAPKATVRTRAQKDQEIGAAACHYSRGAGVG